MIPDDDAADQKRIGAAHAALTGAESEESDEDEALTELELAISQAEGALQKLRAAQGKGAPAGEDAPPAEAGIAAAT